VTLSTLLAFTQRARLRILAASSLTHLVGILSVFVPLRVYLSLKHGIVPEGDGVVETGIALGQVWRGDLTFEQFTADGIAATFLTERSTQLLYPFLISFQQLIGWSIETHLLALNTLLGVLLVVASYLVALRVHDRCYALLVALLMCSLTPLYWIARFGIVDNLFYAMLPVFALFVIGWLRHKSGKQLVLVVLAGVALAFTRPEAMLVILFVMLVFIWNALGRYLSPRAATGVLLLSVTTAAAGAVVVVGSRPSLQRQLLSRSHVAWGLVMSANTLLNRGTVEYNRVQDRYVEVLAEERLVGDELAYRMSTDALAVIKNNPWWYVLKIPLRGLALLFPWTYQPWSLPHVLYEAVYTIFLTGGLLLLIRRARADMRLLVLAAIPLAIWTFLSAYGIDNDLKHRNGILVGLNLVAPLGYFLTPRARSRAGRG
tara:strand:+ start:2034 stop:3323 length:1290 start_codon:yes stop_codon:yes gene_type:complete